MGVENSNAAIKASIKRQRKYTKLMGVIIVLTFFLVTIPCCLFIYVRLADGEFELYDALAPYLGITYCSNSGLNVIFYAIVNSELRAAFLRTLFCRSSTEGQGSSVRPSATRE